MKAILINTTVDPMQVINELKQKQLEQDSTDIKQLQNDNNTTCANLSNDTTTGAVDTNVSTDLHADTTAPIRRRTSTGRISLADRQSSTGVDKHSDIQPNYISVLFRAGMFWNII